MSETLGPKRLGGTRRSGLLWTSLLVGSLTLTPEETMGGPAVTSTEENLTWRSAADPPIEICGLPFFDENEGHWWRLPQRAQTQIADYIWSTSQCSSGARLRFRTDSPSLALRLRCSLDPQVVVTPNMSLIGAAGADCYVDGQFAGSLAPGASQELEGFFYHGAQRRPREIVIHLPLFIDVVSPEVGLETGAEIAPPARFSVERPVVFYGTSITHGGCASRPGLTYEAILCRHLNVDFVNFGFNGCGRGEPAVARLLSEVDASCFVLDFAQNNTSVESYEANYLPFIQTLRASHPATPILCVTPIHWTAELPGTAVPNIHEEMREVVRHAVQACQASGDAHVHLVEGQTLLGPDQGDGLTDCVHPNSLGFSWMADGLESPIRSALGL